MSIPNQEFNNMKSIIQSVSLDEMNHTLLTRDSILKIYNNHKNHINNFGIKEDYALRSLINTNLRHMNMKTNDLSIFFVVGLEKISLNDLVMAENELALKLALQNKDTSDMYIANRMIAQIVSKLPYDLREKLLPETKINILQRIYQLLKLRDITHEPLNFKEGKLSVNLLDFTYDNDINKDIVNSKNNNVENFKDKSDLEKLYDKLRKDSNKNVNRDLESCNFDVSEISCKMINGTNPVCRETKCREASNKCIYRGDVGDGLCYDKDADINNNSNNNNNNNNNNDKPQVTYPVSAELNKKLLEQISQNQINKLQKQGYDLKELYKLMVTMDIGEGSYEEQLQKILDKNTEDKVTHEVIEKNVIHAKYVQKDPKFINGLKDKKLYYFDELSGTLLDVDKLEKVKGEKIKKLELEEILKNHNLNSKQIKNLIGTINDEGDELKLIDNEKPIHQRLNNKNNKIMNLTLSEGGEEEEELVEDEEIRGKTLNELIKLSKNNNTDKNSNNNNNSDNKSHHYFDNLSTLSLIGFIISGIIGLIIVIYILTLFYTLFFSPY